MTTDHAIRRFNQTLAMASGSKAVFRALHALADELVDVRIFTIMRVDVQAMSSRRVYTSDSLNYPLTGTKPVPMNIWFDIVCGNKQSFVANTLEEIAMVFPDHELIGRLGCGSVVNLPVILGGRIAATVNLLHSENHYSSARVDSLERLLTLPAMAAMLYDEHTTPARSVAPV